MNIEDETLVMLILSPNGLSPRTFGPLGISSDVSHSSRNFLFKKSPNRYWTRNARTTLRT